MKGEAGALKSSVEDTFTNSSVWLDTSSSRFGIIVSAWWIYKCSVRLFTFRFLEVKTVATDIPEETRFLYNHKQIISFNSVFR